MYARHQAALAELTQAVLANIALPTLIDRAVALVAATLAVAYSAIWEQAPERGALVLRSAAGWPSERVGQAAMTLEPSSPIATALVSAAPVSVPDWPTETQFRQPALLRDHGVLSSIYVAIPGRPNPFGVLSVDVTASRPFHDEEINFLQTVANVLGLSLVSGRGQVKDELNQLVEMRTREIEQRLLVAAQERAVLEERQRLARDLHDSITQALYGITLHAQAAGRFLTAGDMASVAESLRTLQDTAQEALDEMRLLIFELRPPILEQIGLVAALQARLNAVEGRANLQTRLIADGVDQLPAAVEQALYRIALEALNNALKHAHARHIAVNIRQTKKHVLLEITDDGVGFDSAQASVQGGLGLRGIAERVAQLAGTVHVQSAPGAGTKLGVEVLL
ncbi:MAG TPA: GAF domain-containing sensor histidine kinase [Roseiflexaceae bacterium]|nr:GAF domain-containing sensor histidine kinase [Roseiflexaceae bacterium]